MIDSNQDGKIGMVEIMDFWGAISSNAVRKRIVARYHIHDWDSDKDGKISVSELVEDKSKPPLSELKARFKLADVSKDGKLNEYELRSFLYPATSDKMVVSLVGLLVKSKDTDSDGMLSLHEFLGWNGGDAEGQAAFKNLDRDGDKKLSAEELKTLESGEYHAQDTMHEMIVMADKNDDGHVTVPELDAVREEFSRTRAAYNLMNWAEELQLELPEEEL